MTAGQWLTEFRVADRREGKTQVFTLSSPVRLAWTERDDRTARAKVCKTSHQLFRELNVIAWAKGILTAVTWRRARLGPQALYVLNAALRTAARRLGGKNIVRAFIEDRNDSSVTLRSDWPALLSYLEIRPIFRPLPSEKPRPLNIMSY
ncbi:MAG: hypothetical protein NDI75_07605 [Candidatus Didemnitutus sp.]|nr:hypothetical protein [Candidatus Didemnitutus sp.]